MMADDSPTYRNFITAFTDFLVVAIHTILYERAIYPQTSFLSARKYNYAVRQSRHPKVCEWISDAVAAVENELLKGTVERIAVVMYSQQNKPLERFMFDVSQFPEVPAGEHDVPLRRLDERGGVVDDVLSTVDLEEQFRATMSRLANCGSTLKPLPVGCSFTVAIELKEDGEPPIGHPQAWIPAQPDKGKGVARDGELGTGTTAVPVRAVKAGEMMFETWIEQARDELRELEVQSNATSFDSG
ncbi:hypothetical protein MBLNU230_g2281t1 [Neophaeotheca triangularis]